MRPGSLERGGIMIAEKGKRAVMTMAAAVLVSGLHPAAGIAQSLFEPGARAAGTGGAFVADADDTSALFYNPAGLAFLKGVHVKANLFFGVRRTTATWPPTGGVYATNPLAFRGSFAMSWQFLKRASVGIGFFMPHSVLTEWPFEWPGVGSSLRTRLNPVYFRPAVSVELFKGLSLGVGADFVFSKLWWNHVIHFPRSRYVTYDIPVESREDLSGKGTGFVAGLLWKAHPGIQVGLKYQSQAPLDFTGRNVFVIPTLQVGSLMVPGPYGQLVRLLNEVLIPFYQSQDVTARLTMPRELSGGIMLTPVRQVSLLFDVQWNGWGEFGGWEIRSKNYGGDLSPSFTSLLKDFYGVAPDFGLQAAALALRDVWGFKGGVEYRPSARFAFRGGFARHPGSTAAADLNPVDPDLTQDIISLGFGYEGPIFSVFNDQQIGELSFDVFVRRGLPRKGTSELPGYEFMYRADSWSCGVGVGFNF
jgi:long-chain fatty acid transport protein